MITAPTSKYVSASMPPMRTTADQRPGGERADRDERVHRCQRRGARSARPPGGTASRPRARPASAGRAPPTPSRRTAARAPSRAASAARSARAATSSRTGRPGSWCAVCAVDVRAVSGRPRPPVRDRRPRRGQGRRRTVASSVAKLTAQALTPSTPESVFSTRDAQPAQVMPSMSSRTRSLVTVVMPSVYPYRV